MSNIDILALYYNTLEANETGYVPQNEGLTVSSEFLFLLTIISSLFHFRVNQSNMPYTTIPQVF